MKRSKMVELMAEVMYHNFDGDNGTWEQTADAVLRFIEDNGMTPPLVSGVTVAIGYDARTGEVAAWDTSGNPARAWEREDG